ncbi:MAG: hypothetical protein ACI4DY_01930 [Monoglobaceae bacterium]
MENEFPFAGDEFQSREMDIGFLIASAEVGVKFIKWSVNDDGSGEVYITAPEKTRTMNFSGTITSGEHIIKRFCGIIGRRRKKLTVYSGLRLGEVWNDEMALTARNEMMELLGTDFY